jgi:signal transduction histidine kinase
MARAMNRAAPVLHAIFFSVITLTNYNNTNVRENYTYTKKADFQLENTGFSPIFDVQFYGMKIQYKFLIGFGLALLVSVIPNLMLYDSRIVAMISFPGWIGLSLLRFLIVFGAFIVAAHFWLIRPLNRIARCLALEDPGELEKLAGKKDELGRIALLVCRFFEQRKELSDVMREKTRALEQMAQLESKSRALLNAIPDLLFRVSITGIITDYHAPDPSELFLSPDRFLGRNLEDILPAPVVRQYEQALKEVVTGKKSHLFEYTLNMPDGSERTYEAQLSVTGSGDYLVSIRNITIRKEAENEIMRMLEKQKDLSQMKSNFISLVSHQFRTPLAAISSNVQLLSRYETKWPPEKKAVVIKRIQEAIQNMVLLLEEITLISKDQSGKLSVNPETVRLNQLLEEVIEDLRRTSELPVRLELLTGQGEDTLVTDRELLRQIFLHLISNAGKFNPKDTPVQVQVASHGNSISIKVSDEGIGIPEKDLEHIFQPFHRGFNSEEFPGTGLGMSIVKRCVDLLKGSIDIRSKEGQGTNVEVSIPWQE